ncbi:uncharacterized protein LOC116182071 [Photinus pyralis]|uniref:uncharacterized protein LOC116164937 n=1 Tax=Photinus pyralis TaxID=7054 RepID=UPI0012672D2A|nr:uncharacterized protein LOC116164937 [Photinus pyralis]XP_031358430.1 uncharacterized protein LOC116182071 [Photinus pyralis]
MVQITGKYKLQKCENASEFTNAIGVPAHADKLSDPGLEVNVTLDGNVYIFDYGFTRFRVMLDEEWTEPLIAYPVTLTNTGKLDGNTLTVTTTADDGRYGTRVYDFTQKGFVQTLTVMNVTAKRHFARVN